MKNFSFLEVSTKTSPLGKLEAFNYRWIGKSPYIQISGSEINDDVGIIQKRDLIFGPYRLKFVDYDFLSDTGIYVRADKLGAVRVAIYKSTRLLDLVYRRMIITLAVWKLAEFHPTRVPTWRDVKILKRFAKR